MAGNDAGVRPKLNPEVLKLGLVSFLTDLSSEANFSVFAVFFTTVAGASNALLGLIQGLADFSASSLNYLAGWLSDRSSKRKGFALAGYGFWTLAKTIPLVSASIAGLGVGLLMVKAHAVGFSLPTPSCCTRCSTRSASGPRRWSGNSATPSAAATSSCSAMRSTA